MFFRNDDPGPISDADVQAMHAALRMFNTIDEVRFGEDIRILAPILNTLTQTQKKFYLVHLPDGAGWVLRRHRPTGVYLGKPVPEDASEPTQPGDAGPDTPEHPVVAPQYAEEYFGKRDS